MINYRPWGTLTWLISKLSSKKYDYYGCISTEHRSLETYRHLVSINALRNHRFLEIIDLEDTEAHKFNRESLITEYKSITTHRNLSKYELLCPIGNIHEDIVDFIAKSDGELILDITSFPKRFFFPLIKIILKSKKIKTLIVTYSTPKEYCDTALSESPMDWNHIPMFDSDDPDKIYQIALIGLGFMPLGLSSLLKDKFDGLELRLLFPFPPGAPFFQRTWKFIEDITPTVDFKKILRTDALNVSDVFNIITSLSDNNQSMLMAPYGPKTMSLAMCLYACLTDSPVYYTQPTVYDSKYSEGTSACYGYCIKLNGRNLYELVD